MSASTRASVLRLRTKRSLSEPIHQSNDVWTLEFDSGDTLGVTANHPIYSTTAQDWRLAGELAIGEQVLTYAGSATLTGKRPAPAQTVYNLEVQEVHNFLVAGVGVVVHNSCWKTIDDALDGAKTSSADLSKMIKDGWDEGIDWNPIDGGRATGYFGRGRFFEGLLWKGKYRKNGYKYTGADDLGEGIGAQNYPVVDVYKGNVATSIKTASNNNPWAWRNSQSANGIAYNKKHLDDIIDGLEEGGFGTHSDLQNIQKVDLDVYVKEINQVDYPESVWQQMVDDYLADSDVGASHLIGKIKVNLSTVENSL